MILQYIILKFYLFGNIDTISSAAGKQRSGRSAAAMGWD